MEFRCNCPITTGLDYIGDRWNLVIIKQILFQNKWTYKDLINSDENISTNILATRLKFLVENGILYYQHPKDNNKVKYYILTQKGLDLVPLIVEINKWSNKYLRSENPSMLTNRELGIELLETDSEKFIHLVIQDYKRKVAETDLQVYE